MTPEDSDPAGIPGLPELELVPDAWEGLKDECKRQELVIAELVEERYGIKDELKSEGGSQGSIDRIRQKSSFERLVDKNDND